MHRLATDRLVRMQWPNSTVPATAAGRFTHAFIDGTAHTLCGVSIGTLYWEEIAHQIWDDLSPMLRCHRCELEMSRPPQLS